MIPSTRWKLTAEAVISRTASKGADAVFEVSGTQAGADAALLQAPEAECDGRHSCQQPQVDMFQFFWRELADRGSCVKEDYEKAISIIVNGGVDADTIITDVSALQDIQSAFDNLDSSPTALKSVIKQVRITGIQRSIFDLSGKQHWSVAQSGALAAPWPKRLRVLPQVPILSA